MKREDRSQRERDCQLVALGVLLANGVDAVETSDFIDHDVARVVEAMKRGGSDRTAVATVKEFGTRKLGVTLGAGEKLSDATVRTCRENASRRSVMQRIEALRMKGHDWTVDDMDFLKQVAALAGEVM